MTKETSPLNDPRAEKVLERLHAEPESQQLSIRPGTRFRGTIVIDADQGRLLYLLARATGARHIVEFGTWLGLSTIYFACAVRDNGGGKVIGSERVESRVKKAQAHLEEAGVSQCVDIEHGEARETLAKIDKPIDLAFLDGDTTLFLDILKIIEPHLRAGALVLAHDVDLFRSELEPMLRYIQDPVNGYRGATMPLRHGFLICVRV